MSFKHALAAFSTVALLAIAPASAEAGGLRHGHSWCPLDWVRHHHHHHVKAAPVKVYKAKAVKKVYKKVAVKKVAAKKIVVKKPLK